MQKNWKLVEPSNPDLVPVLHKELLSYSNGNFKEEYLILSKLLVNRGIKSVEEAKKFNRFRFDSLHDPFLMKDMKKAVSRVLSAVGGNEKIMIYGDYDVDGTTSVALMTSFLKTFTSNFSYYIPDRYTEGYGISEKGIREASNQGVKLIIALDCGIKATKKVELANSLNIDFIICDHHTPGDQIPDCVAVLDPKRDDCSYPYKELSGAAIGFKLCQAIVMEKGLNPQLLESLTDLVAISLACDIVPLTGENRVLCGLGLKSINENPRASLKTILGEKDPNQNYSVTDLVFGAGPKINAAGRMSSGIEAVNLLISEDENEIEKTSRQIIQHNSNRKSQDEEITKEALSMLTTMNSERNTNVVYKSDWHKGVIGIVASRIIEHHYKPTVIFTQSTNDFLTGSVRSVKGFNVYNALEACNDVIHQFGGHKYAAGLTIASKNYDKFKRQFELAVSEQMEVNHFTPELPYEIETPIDILSFKLKALMDKLAPFGPSNSTPNFISRGVIDSGNSRTVGSDNSHLKIEVTDPNSGTCIGGIGFGLGHCYARLSNGQPFDILYSLDINYWKNTQKLQLMVKDIKFQDML